MEKSDREFATFKERADRGFGGHKAPREGFMLDVSPVMELEGVWELVRQRRWGFCKLHVHQLSMARGLGFTGYKNMVEGKL